MPQNPVLPGELRLGRKIGRGGDGDVWSADHLPTGTPLAIKRVREHTATLEREVRAVASLDHPGVLAVYDLLTAPTGVGLPEGWVGKPLLVMERALGSLRQYPSSDVHDLTRQVLAALGHTHARDLVHRDIKPGNLLLGQDGRFKLADFGLAQVAGSSLSGASGTLQYMAPEQVRQAGRELGPWTDLYSLGILVFELIFGHLPFQGTPASVLRAHVETPLPLGADVPLELAVWLTTMTAKDPLDRFQSAAEARAAMPGAEVFEAAGGAELATSEASTFTWSDSELIVEVADLAEPVRIGSTDVAVSIPERLPEPDAPRAWIPGTGLGLWGMTTPRVIGRTAIREQVWDVARSALTGEGPAAVLLQGSAGVGKSHLARWLVAACREHAGAASLVVLHEPGSSATGALTEMVVRDVRGEGLDPDELLMHMLRWSTARGASMDQAKRVAGGIRSRGRDVVPLTIQHIVRRTERQPVVLWVDDVQWGPAACRVATALLQRDLPLLLVATARPDASGAAFHALAEHPATTRIALHSLDLDAVEGLVEDALHVEPGVARQVAERSEGHPLFAVQIVADLVQRGVLVTEASGYALADGASVDLPDDLRIAWTRRVDHVLDGTPEAWRQALWVAAMLGRDVERSLWESALAELDNRTPTGDLVGRLIREELWVVGRGTDWTFVHGLLAEALVAEAVESPDARAMHQACDAALAALEDQTHRSVAARRAWHKEALGDLEEAARLRLSEAHYTSIQVSVPEAWKRFEQARALLDRIEAPSSDLESYALLTEARIHEAGGDVHEAIARYDRITGAPDGTYSPEIRARALYHHGVIHGQKDPPAAAVLLERAISELEALGEQQMADSARGVLAIRMLRTGQVDCGRALVQAVTETRAFNLMLARGQLLATDSDFEAAEAAYLQAAEVAIDTGHRAWLVDTYLLRGDAAARHGDVDTALGHLDAAERLLAEVGSHEATLMRGNRGMVLMAFDRLEEAAAIFEEIRDDLVAVDALRMVRVCDAGLVHVAARLGWTDRISEYLERLVDARDAGLLELSVRQHLFHPDVSANADVAAFLVGVEAP